MSTLKKKLSVNLIKQIEPLVKEYSTLLKIKQSMDFIFCLVDSDINSNFYFGILKESSDSSGHYVHYQCCPQSSTSNAVTANAYKIEDFSEFFKHWLKNIAFYNEESILDDPILTGYEKEYYEDFKIVDDNADSVGFNYDQQLLLNEFLENVLSGIDEYRNSNNDSLISEIQLEATNLQMNVTTQTKNAVMKAISRLFAKGRKSGLKASNFMIKEFLKKAAEQGASWAFNFAVSHMTEVPKYIQHLTIKLIS